MSEIKKKYNINGKDYFCKLHKPFLHELLRTFLNKKVNQNYRIAVAVNDVLIEKKEWKKKKIFHEDRIEIVTPFFGG
tara:strand:- start:1105 stop:1335 length:231 start_codon:yes stop_codon:yes gene_type:complete